MFVLGEYSCEAKEEMPRRSGPNFNPDLVATANQQLLVL